MITSTPCTPFNSRIIRLFLISFLVLSGPVMSQYLRRLFRLGSLPHQWSQYTSSPVPDNQLYHPSVITKLCHKLSLQSLPLLIPHKSKYNNFLTPKNIYTFIFFRVLMCELAMKTPPLILIYEYN